MRTDKERRSKGFIWSWQFAAGAMTLLLTLALIVFVAAHLDTK